MTTFKPKKIFEPGKAEKVSWKIHKKLMTMIIHKNLVTTKIGSYDLFLAKIKFSEPGKAKNVSRVRV